MAAETAWDQVAQAVTAFDDLSSADPGLLTTRLMAAQARARGIKVLLVGEGADEIFGGYPWFGVAQWPYAFLPRAWRWRGYHYGTSRQGFRGYRGIAELAGRLGADRRDDTFRAISRFEITQQLPNHLLPKVDKSTMAAGVEARVPYLDHRVVEVAFSLARAQKLPGRWFRHDQAREKRILRQLGARYLPSETVARKKRGFLFPVSEFLAAHAERIREVVDHPRSAGLAALGVKDARWLFTPQRWPLLEWERHMLLWKLLVMELWTNAYLTSPPRRAAASLTPVGA